MGCCAVNAESYPKVAITGESLLPALGVGPPVVRRMLRHGAIKTWGHMQNIGVWRR